MNGDDQALTRRLRTHVERLAGAKFWRRGYPAVMVTDTAFYRCRHYHAPTGTPDKLAYPELAQVTLGLFKAFAVLVREGGG